VKQITIIPSGNDLIDEVASCVPAEAIDARRIAIVFPGKRPGHFLLRAIARRLGRIFIPPRIMSIDELVDVLHGQIRNGNEVPMSTLDAVSILFDIHRSRPEPYGGNNFLQFSSFFPLGLKFFGEFEELVLAGVNPGRFRKAVGIEGRNEFLVLADLYESFSQAISDRGISTRATRYRQVSEHIRGLDISRFDQLVLAGIQALTRAEEDILRGLMRLDNVRVLLQEGPETAETLRRLGVSAGNAAASVKRTILHFYKTPDTHAQVFEAGAVLRDIQHRGETLDERTVIVLPDAGTLFPVLQQVLPLIETATYNISLGYPIVRTPVFGFLDSLMKVIASVYDGRFYAPEYLQFVLHPFTKNIRWRGNEEITRILFHAMEETFAGSRAKRFFSLEELEEDEVLLESLALAGGRDQISADEIREHLRSIHDHTLRRFLSFDNMGVFMQRVAEVLHYIADQSSAQRYWLFAPFFDAISTSLDAVIASGLRGIVLSGPPEYFRFLRSYLESEQVPFHGTPLHGVQVLGFLETRNIRFKRVIMLDASDDVMPGSGGHQLLPSRLRTVLGMPTVRDRERSMHHDFSVLVGNAEQVHFFFTEHGRKEKSRFLAELLWREQSERKSLDAAPPVHSLQYATRLSNAVPASVPKTDAMSQFLQSMPVSTAALDTYLHCGLKFFHRYVLNLREREDVTGDIARREIGTFIHAILAEFLRPAVGVPLTVFHLDQDRLDMLIDQEFAREYGDDAIRARFLLKNQIKRHLHDFLEEYQIPIARNASPVIEGVELQWKVTHNDVTFTGKTDRIERRGEKTFILDYKTGSRAEGLKINFRKLDPGNRATWSSAIGSLQLPLYTLMVHSARKEDVERIIPAYIMLGRHKLDPGIEMKLFQEGSPHRPTFEILERIIMDLVGEIRDPGLDFLPATDLETQCPRCPFTTLCGTGWIEARQSF
jgi:ATP-dependent helicase/nuclease subunit B